MTGQNCLQICMEEKVFRSALCPQLRMLFIRPDATAVYLPSSSICSLWYGKKQR